MTTAYDNPVTEPNRLPARPTLGDLEVLLQSLPALSDEEAKAFAGDIDEARAQLTWFGGMPPLSGTTEDQKDRSPSVAIAESVVILKTGNMP